MIECRGIVKRFPGVTALDRVSFIISQKKITGVLGENGAGKSTLMNILFGLVQPDEGVMLLDGKVYHPRNPSDGSSEPDAD
jgi:ABC-type sugar transport system ATPase subunit